MIGLNTTVPQVAADDYTVTVTKVQISDWCHHLDWTDDDEEWAWNFIVDGESRCVTGRTDNNLPWEQALQWEADFTTQSSQLTLKIDAWEKDADGAMCVWANGDYPAKRVQSEIVFPPMTAGQVTNWNKSMTFPHTDNMRGYTCSTTVQGNVAKLTSTTVTEGEPRITAATVVLADGIPRLRISGKELNPDPQESPVVQVTAAGGGGSTTGCITSSIVASAVQITCDQVKPESAVVSSLDLQVQVQTRFGLSRIATAAFAQCAHECQNGGECWWSKEIADVECVCPELYYGDWCQNEYSKDEPILLSTAPLGGDYTLETETVIALEGRVIPELTLAMSARCQKDDVVWEGPVVPPGGRFVAQSDSLTIGGLCVMPPGHLAAYMRSKDPDGTLSHLKVAVVWAAAANGSSLRRESKAKGTFMLYGPLDMASSMVRAVGNEADGGEMRVLREQSVRVSLLDKKGRNRVGGEDADLFFLDFSSGPSLQPQAGVDGGVAKQFRYAGCRKNEDDPTCAYYEFTMTFLFSGTYRATVLALASGDSRLVELNKQELTFEVRGLGDMALPVPSMLKSSISWADSLRDRDAALPLFDTNLAQTVSPNTGAADRLGVLEGLFERVQGRWFSQRQTVSVAFESGPSEVSMGSVHTVLAQGIDDPFFCDTHTDQLKAGVMTRSLKPWRKVGNVPRQFALSSVSVGEAECVSSVSVNVVLVHNAPDDIRITLTRVGKQSAAPRATNISTTIVLKDFGTATMPQEITFRTVPGLSALAGRPVRADWVLDVQQRAGSTGKGFVRDWGLNVASDNCLNLEGGPAICGFGPGQLFARGATDDDDVHLECPAGGIITEIVWARYGRIEGSCEDVATATTTLTVHDECEAPPATVKKRVASACVGHTSCTVHAIDTLYAEEEGEPFLCAGEQVECREDRSLLAERSSRRQARHESREHHAQAHMAPVTYAGTEDHYFKSTMVRHRTEPFFRPRRDVNSSSNNGSDPSMGCSSEPRVKKALMVQARCKDANAAFKHTDTPAVAKKMVMASASGDLDNDWKDEVVTLFGYEGGALHASFTAVGANGQPTTTVVRDLAVGGGGGGSAVVLGEGAHIEMAMGDFDNDDYPELAFAFVDGASGGGGSGGALKVFLWDLRVQSTAVWGSSVAKTNREDLQPCYACFTDIAKLRGLFATAVEVAVPGMPSFPIVLTGAAATAAGVESGSRLEAGGFGYSLAAAKVNALPSMLAVAWIADRSTVSWALFRQTAQSAAAAAMVSASPYSLVSLRQPHAVAVNLGDYEGSGFAELALGIVDDDELTLYLYSIDELALDGTLPMALQKTLPITAAPWWDTPQYNVRMVSGDLNNDGDDELVVALTSATEGSGSQADVFRVDSAACFRLACLELVGNFAFTLPSGPTVSASAIAAVEGIVDVTTTATTTTAGSVEEQMTTTRSPEIKLAIGNVDESYANELLVAFEYSPTITSASAAPKVMLTSLTAQPDPDRPFVVNGRQCYAGPAYQRGEEVAAGTVNNMALSVGNLYGLGYRVGESIKVRFESVPELIAVINAPPTHFDIVDGKEVVVNPRTFNGYGSSTRLSNAEGVASSFTISRDLVHTTATSVDASARAKVVAVVANAGVQFEEMKKRANELGQSTVEQISVSRELVASGDDVVLYMSTTRDLWKFPIVDQNGAQVGSLDIWASSSCGEDCVQKGDGRDLWWFTPDHEPFNVLTYSARAPEDFNPANRIMVGEKVTLGPNEHQQAVTQSSSKAETKMGGQHNSTAADKSLSVGVNINQNLEFRASFLGVGMAFDTPDLININIQGTGAAGTSDDDEASQLRRAAIERDVSVVCYVEPINPEHAYRVQPFVWMARAPDGREYLKVDYTAEPGYYPGVSTWWERTYSKPDPTFNLPWWWTTFKRDRTMLTKEMVATPAVPREEGEVVEVAVTVRNKALVDARNVKVALWRGSPDNCLDEACLLDDNALIGIEEVGLIPSQGKREVWFLFRFDGVQNIHATIDDNDELDEMHEDNNHAYALLFHDMANSGYTLQTLRLDPAIAVSPVVASDGSGLTIGYQVKATVLGDTFTRANVLVQLWHGGVGGTGRLIGTVLVPRVTGSTNETKSSEVSIFWETRNPTLFGKQELHAVILHSGFSTEAANVISHVSRTVSVACYGRVDACGVCGGNDGTCGGCDGVALSGKTVDACGVCGGNGSTCCIPKPAQAQWHYVRIDHHHHNSNIHNGDTKRTSTNGSSTAAASASSSSSSLVTWVRVGDLVVWENLLDRKVEITGGAYDYNGAPAVDLSRFNGQPDHDRDHDQVDDHGLGVLLAQWIKDLVEVAVDPSGGRHGPAPDSTTQYLRRRSTTAASAVSPQHDDAELFPGWRVTSPVGNAFFETRSTRRKRSNDGSPTDSAGAADTDDDGDKEEEQYAMSGVCCGPTADKDDHDDDHNRRVARRQANARWSSPPSGRSSSSGSRSLRALVVSKLVELRQQQLLQPLSPAIANSTGTPSPLLPAADWAIARRTAAKHASSTSSETRCLCRAKRNGDETSSLGIGPSGSGSGSAGLGVGPSGLADLAVRAGLAGLGVGPSGLAGLGVGPSGLAGLGVGPSGSAGVGRKLAQSAIRAALGIEGGPKDFVAQLDTMDNPASQALTIIEKAPGAISAVLDPAALVAQAGEALTAIASNPLTLLDATTLPGALAAMPVQYSLNKLDDMLKKCQDEAPQGCSAQWVMSSAGRVGVGVMRHGVAMGVAFLPMAAGMPPSPMGVIGSILPLIRDLIAGVSMGINRVNSGAPALTDRAPLRLTNARSTTEAQASRNNETMSAWADPAQQQQQQRGLRSLMAGSRPGGGGAKYSTTLVDAVAAPGSDGRAVLAPGGASVPHRFFSPGLYLWHDQRNTAIHGVIVVEPSDVAVDACGVCGGDNSTCTDCLGVPHGAARWDACGTCSDPTAAGYVPNPAIDCAGVCHGEAVLDACGQCTGGTTGRLPGASMDCKGVCGGSARVDCKGVCRDSAQPDWHEGRPSNVLDIACPHNDGCYQESFNWRKEHSCPTTIRDQGLCGSGAAFAVATAATDRACGLAPFSAQELLDCLPPLAPGGNPCEGESNMAAAQHLSTSGLPPVSCRGDRFFNGWDNNPPVCKPECDNGSAKSVTAGISAAEPLQPLARSASGVAISVKDLMSEIQANGPVAANIFVCHSLLNFYNTTPTDVYSGDCSATSWDFVGGHVVTIIGWGTDEGKDYWLFANSWGPTWGDRGYGRIARGRDTAGIETWEITAVAMARSPQLRSNAPHHEQADGHDDGQAEAQQQRQQSRSAAAASDIVPGAPVQGNVRTAHAYHAAQAVLESWNGKLAASGSAPYQVGSINSITYQVVSGVLVTTDLTLTNGANTVNLVATQYLGAAALGSSMLAMTTVAVVLAALGGAALLVVLSASAVAGTVVYRKHRQAQQTPTREESAQFSSHMQIEMDMIVQGIQSIKKAEKAGPLAHPMAFKVVVAEAEEAEEAEAKPTWRMRIKSITARSPTILVDSTNTSRQPVPLGAIIAEGRSPQQQGTNNADMDSQN